MVVMAESFYPPDYFDGDPRPPKVVRDDELLGGTHVGTIYVQRSRTLTLSGTHEGSLCLEPSSVALIAGTHRGSLGVQPEASAIVTGFQHGSLSIDEGLVVVEPTGTASGSVENRGRFVVRGTQAGPINGPGTTEVDPRARICQPVRRRGQEIYHL